MEPVGTFGILIQAGGCSHKTAAMGGGAGHKRGAAPGGETTYTGEAQVQGKGRVIFKIHWKKEVREKKTNSVVAAATETMLF